MRCIRPFANSQLLMKLGIVYVFVTRARGFGPLHNSTDGLTRSGDLHEILRKSRQKMIGKAVGRTSIFFFCVASRRRGGRSRTWSIGEGERRSGIRRQRNNRQRTVQQIGRWSERRETFISPVRARRNRGVRYELPRWDNRSLFK